MLKHLNIDEMVALVSPWVSNTKRKKTFRSIPEIAGLYPQAVDAHKAVLAVRPIKPSMVPELRAIDEKQTVVDNRHDHLARGITLLLDASREFYLAADPPDEERAARCDEINLKVFPTGMSIVIASYLAEYGNTARVEKLLQDEPAIADFLRQIPAPNRKTLEESVELWVGSGAELEALEHEREEVLVEQAIKPATQATVQAARNQWFNVVTAVLANLRLSRAPAEAIEAIRGPLLRASDRAAKRYASGKPGDEVLDAEEQGNEAEEETGEADAG